jgi:gliding motility-associated lipoprotein GldH
LKSLFLLFITSAFLLSCDTIDLYEKVTPIPGHEWKSDFKPRFNFTITDSTAMYDVFVVLRHNEKYEFNNIWISLTTQRKGDSVQTGQYELPLANNEGWMGSAMDDLYEHRIRITPADGIRLRAGEYSFTIGHIMRKDPLENVMNIGLRIEKRGQ